MQQWADAGPVPAGDPGVSVRRPPAHIGIGADESALSPHSRRSDMDTDLFAFLCDELGYDPSTVLTIRVRREQASVTYTEQSGMPRGRVHQLDGDTSRRLAAMAWPDGREHRSAP